MPSISNCEVGGSGHLHGSHHRFNCRPGYSLVGRAILYCTNEGKWSASVPICLRGIHIYHKLNWINGVWLQHLLQESLTKFCDAFSEPQNACFVGLSSGVMTTANTNAIFGCRDAG